jgi:Uma2 family endonuclease
MSTEVRLITADELFRMNPKQRCELVKGELRIMSPAGFQHGAIIIQLSTLLANHVHKHKLGVVAGAETGYKLAKNPDTVRGADVSFVSAQRLPNPLPTKFWDGAPDLAVEVVSPDDTLQEVEDKVDEYLAAGAKLVWVVNPKRRTLTIHRPSGAPQVLRDADELSGEDVIPGFRCSVAAIFE